MPIIDEITGPIPLAVLNGWSGFSANGSVQSYFIAHLSGTSGFLANGNNITLGKATLPGLSAFAAVGRVNGDANRFGKVTMAGHSAFVPTPRFVIGGKCVMPSTSGFSARGRIAGADAAECKIFLTIADALDNGSGQTYSARLTADGVQYAIRGFQYSEPRQSFGETLNVTLQRPDQRDAILAASSFKFEVYTGAEWEILFEAGQIAGGQFAIAWADGQPANSLSISTTAPISAALATSPPLNLTVYDPFREQINASDYENIIDENGHIYAHSLVAIADMKLHDLLNFVFVTRLHFDRVVPTLPNFPVRRADFGMTGSYMDGIRVHVGNYEPLIFVENNVVYVLDSTVRLPAGFTPSIVLDHTQYLNAQFNETRFDADGFLVSYTENDVDYDYIQTRDVPVPTAIDGTAGSADYTETDVVRSYNDYYKYSDPATPIRSQKTKEVTTVRALVTHADGSLLLTEINETTETITFDSKMRLSEIEKNVIALIPNLTSFVPFDFVTATVRNIRTTFEYKPDIFDPRREYLSNTVTKATALVATENDPDKLHIGQKFKQDFYDAWRSGNFTDTMTVATAPVKLVVENAQQTKKGQTEIRQRTVDYLTDPPNVHNEVTDGRTGDNTQNANAGSAATTIVYRDGISARAGEKLVDISVNDLPPKFFRPLCKRKLKLRRRRDGATTIKGLSLSMRKGSSFGLTDQDGISAGNYIVEGRSIQAANLGTREQQSRQTLEVIQI